MNLQGQSQGESPVFWCPPLRVWALQGQQSGVQAAKEQLLPPLHCQKKRGILSLRTRICLFSSSCTCSVDYSDVIFPTFPSRSPGSCCVSHGAVTCCPWELSAQTVTPELSLITSSWHPQCRSRHESFGVNGGIPEFPAAHECENQKNRNLTEKFNLQP